MSGLKQLIIGFFGSLLLVMTASGAVLADSDELVLVVNPASGVDELTRYDVINLYMGRMTRLPSGISVLPLDLVAERGEFYRVLVDKRLAEINSYWARLVFSGRASPPRQVETADALVDIVAQNPGAIGYVRRSALNDRVRVIAEVRMFSSETMAQAE